jgi:D-alanyl-D-alanine endopeptidase (penicillin-binding protein 7)
MMFFLVKLPIGSAIVFKILTFRHNVFSHVSHFFMRTSSYRRLFVICLSVAMACLVAPLSALAVGFTPVPNVGQTVDPVNEEEIASALLVDVQSGKILYQYQPARVWTAASLTKLATAHVFTSTPTNWSGNVAITKADEVGGGRLQVSAGSIITLRDMLYSALIGSANNCAETMGRVFDRQGKEAFIKKMNARVKEIGLVQSEYFDASGMNEKNTLSAYDTAVMIAETGEDPESAKAMSLVSYSFTVKKPVLNKTIKTTNDLLIC